MPTDLRVAAVRKSFGGQLAVDDVSFSVREGEVISILGPSGCGKTTLLRMVAGLERPDAGTITLGEQVLYRDQPPGWVPPEGRGVGMVFQDFGLWPHLTVRESVRFALRFGRRAGLAPSARAIAARVQEALLTLQIAELADRLPHQLSGGQQQRVAFARATVARPRLLLLDEPFNALDPTLRAALREELLGMLRQDRLTVLHVTHDHEEALAMSDRILVMSGGRLLQYDTPENLYRSPGGPAVAGFLGRANLIPVRVVDGGGPGGRVALPDGRTYAAAGLLRDGSSPLPAPGHPLVALLRPEDLDLSPGRPEPAPPGGRVELGGTVAGAQFLGDRYAVHVFVSGVGRLVCYAGARPDDGTAVVLSAPLDRVRLLTAGDPDPEGREVAIRV